MMKMLWLIPFKEYWQVPTVHGMDGNVEKEKYRNTNHNAKKIVKIVKANGYGVPVEIKQLKLIITQF